jgi:eukaryotic-like serine/threonine-protein kinase
MIGRVVSHYEIVEILGEGGMGIVYKARDTKLDRTVALKFLPPHLTKSEEDKQRFLREAKAASSLDHPNICTIHEINETTEGQLFIVMPAYEGETLAEKIKSGPLVLDEALDIAIQVAEGLQVAHEKQIVHRDIKSSNIFVTSKGQVKIMDFGLAQKSDLREITKTNILMGTVPYISPEQIRGEILDHRTDIWSFGVILYEMITGHLPFRSNYNEAIIFSILKEEPDRVKHINRGVPDKLDHIVKHALKKNRTERYRTAGDVLHDLKMIKAGLDSDASVISLARRKERKYQSFYRYSIGFIALSGAILIFVYVINHQPQLLIDSIAVLSFENLSGDPQRDYFADAITEQITSELARLPGLTVLSRSSIMHYKSNPKRIRDIAKELRVKAIVTGSVDLIDEDIRITVHIIDGINESYVWTNEYVRDFSDLVALQKDIAREIADEMGIDLPPDSEVYFTTSREIDREAQHAYIHGIYYLTLYYHGGVPSTAETLHKSIESFEKAIEIEPEWAEAHAKLAGAYQWSASSFSTGPENVREQYEKSRKAALTAIELDNSVADAHGALGFVLHYFDRDWEGAEHAYKRAFELEPNSHYRWGYALYLKSIGRYDESVEYFPLDREPLSRVLRIQLALTLGCAGRYDEAFEVLREFAPPGSVRHDWLLAIRELAEGSPVRAIEHLEKHFNTNVDPDPTFENTMIIPALAYAYAISDREAEARTLLTVLESWKFWTPHLYVALGEVDEAVLQLEWAWENYLSNFYLYIGCMPDIGYADLTQYEGLRDHPQFQDLLRRINFPELQ